MDRNGFEFIIMVKGCKELVNTLIIENKGKLEDEWENAIPYYDVNGMTVKAPLFDTDEKERFFHIYYEHLYEFCMDNRMYSDWSYQSDPEYEDEPLTKIAIDKLKFEKGQNFSLHYDFGDDWMFTIHVQKIEKEEEETVPKVIKAKGEIEQYPLWDDWGDDDKDLE